MATTSRKKGKGGLIAAIGVLVVVVAGAAVAYFVVYPAVVRGQIEERYVELDKAVNGKDLEALDAITKPLGIVDRINGLPMAQQLLDVAAISMTTQVESIEVKGRTASAMVDRKLSISARVPLLNVDFGKQWAGKDVDTWEKVDGEWRITQSRGAALGSLVNTPPGAPL